MPAIGFLFDENMLPAYQVQLKRRLPGVTVIEVGMPDAPPKGTPDPEILCWCEDHGLLLVSNNRRTMPVHLSEHLAAGHHVPGVLLLHRKAAIGPVLATLELIAVATTEEEYQDRVAYIPI